MRALARSLAFLAAVLPAAAAAQPFTEAFDAGVPGTWTVTNNSNPAGSTSWFTGNTAVFAAQAGAGYAAANFNAAGTGGAISDWLISPNFTNLQNGEVLTFFTRTEASAPAPDSLEVRLSLNGGSTNVGATSASVGDFTTLLVAINPALTPGGFPSAWTAFSVTLSGLPPGVSSGRIAFRYVVPDTATAGDYVGIDTLNLAGPPPVDLGITKTASSANPALASNVTFTVTVANPGSTAATGVVVTDLLPAGLAFVSATPSQGTYVPGSGLWTVGTIAGAGSATLAIVATVTTGGAHVNTATITAADQPDPTPANNASSATVTPGAAALADVPALGPLALALLATILALAGWAALRRSV